MPLPPDAAAATEAVESGQSFEFSRVECLLYIFHQVARNHTEFLTDNEERLKDFRLRYVKTNMNILLKIVFSGKHNI